MINQQIKWLSLKLIKRTNKNRVSVENKLALPDEEHVLE